MISPIAHYLPEFPAYALGFEAPGESLADIEGFEDTPAIVPDETEQRLAEARAEGFSEGSATLEAALAAQAAEFEARHAQELEAARRATSEAAAALAARVDTALGDLETKLADAVVSVLEPVFEQAIRRKAAEDLRVAVTSLIATGQGTALRISGPADLVEPLRLAFDGKATIETEETDGPEIELEAGGTLIRSQLATWAATLETHLKETV